MKYFKNKFFIAALAVALAVVIFTSVLSVMGLGDQIKNAVNTCLYPARWCVDKIGDAMSGFGEYFSNMDALIEENQRLKEEIESLESEKIQLEVAKEENRRLREYLEVKKSHPDYELKDAMVIASESGNYMTVLTLNRGTADGVKLGMPVITSAGLVGYVCEIGYSSCKVRTLIEASFAAGAYVSRSGEIGIVEGDIALKDSNSCEITYLPEGADIEVGDLIFTSGEGSVYPRDLYIGRVSEVGINEYNRTVFARIECAVDLTDLKYVMVITDFDIYDEEMTADMPEDEPETDGDING